MKTIRCVLMLVALMLCNAQASALWGTTWGESFNSVKLKFPEAKVLDTSLADYCKGSSEKHCQQRQVILDRMLAGGLPGNVIFVFSPDQELTEILVFVDKANKYPPSRLGLAYSQIQLLLEKDLGKAVGASQFVLRPDPSRFKNDAMSGKATSVWHTNDSIVSVEIFAFGADSEDRPTQVSGLYITYRPLKLMVK